MKNLQTKILNKVGIDRMLHFAFGGWIACAAPTWFYALLVGFCIGLVKELFDKYIKKSQFDLYDLSATLVGSVVTATIIFIMKIIGG